LVAFGHVVFNSRRVLVAVRVEDDAAITSHAHQLPAIRKNDS
jgi:hypothetical protein